MSQVDWAFWPAAQFINFRFVPGSLRVLYVSFAALLWNIFLSYIKHDHVRIEAFVDLVCYVVVVTHSRNVL